MPKKVYISGSVQEANLYAAGLGTEEQHMQAIARRVAELLASPEVQVFLNDPSWTLRQIISDSNAKQPDVHVAIHSNAGGGEGTEVWYWPPDPKSERLAQCLYDEIAPLSPGKDRGLKDGSGFREINSPIAVAALIEVEYHDRLVGAKYIASNHEALAQAIARGIRKYLGIPAPVVTVPAGSADNVARLVVNGKEIPGGAVLIDGKAYAWARGLGEALGCMVAWGPATKTVTITSPQ